MTKLHMSIAASSESDIQGLMINETPILKVGLLYADQVSLSSHVSTFLNFVSKADNNQFTSLEKATFMKYNIGILYSYGDYEQVEILNDLNCLIELLLKKDVNSREVTEVSRLEKKLHSKWLVMKDIHVRHLETSGIRVLTPFLKEGILETIDMPIPEDHQDEGIQEGWTNKIVEILNNPNTYPLLHRTAINFLTKNDEFCEIDGQLIDSGKAAHAGLVSDVYQQLPSFENTSFDQIYDIRKELKKPLDNFRAAMLEYSNRIESLPWHTTFKEEADGIYLNKVLPAVKEVEEACEENKPIQKIVKRVLHEGTEGLIGQLGIGIITEFNPTSMIISTLGQTGFSSVKGIKDWKNENQKIEGMRMFYYTKLAKNLK